MLRKKLEKKIGNLEYKEKANEKGLEISKVTKIAKARRKKYEIEIQKINHIESGVEVFAKVWENGEQIGFGDGTVDVERFKIYNPPILVEDENGDIIGESQLDNGEIFTKKFREDPEEALLQCIEDTLSVMKSKHDSSKIIEGKIGNTTSTFYPSAGASSPVDGGVRNNPTATSFATIRGASTGTDASPTASVVAIQLRRPSGTNYDILARFIALFDTSSLGSSASISSATLSLKFSAGRSDNYSQSINITSSNPASTSNITTSDYNVSNFGSTELSTAIGVTSLSTTLYNDWALNASGIAEINKTGISKFAFRMVSDITNSEPAGSGAKDAYANADAADTSGTTSDPKLVVEHTTVASSFIPRILSV